MQEDGTKEKSQPVALINIDQWSDPGKSMPQLNLYYIPQEIYKKDIDV